MGNEAHREPSMEEILASIRKIISDEEGAQAQEGTPSAQYSEDSFDDFVLEEDAHEDLAEAQAEDEHKTEFQEELSVVEDEDVFESGVEQLPEQPAPPPMAEPGIAFESAPTQFPDTTMESSFSVAPSAPIVEPPVPAEETETMQASPAYEKTTLTDETTADKAAGALGKLISGMDLGGENTLEGMVRELLKPMIKEWLDDNLPKIVEDKVEAEVQRIAKMAR